MGRNDANGKRGPIHDLVLHSGYLQRPSRTEITESVRAAIREGRLQDGDRLPSTRQLAGELGMSRSTLAAAYEELAGEGRITSRQGSGTFVLAAGLGDTADIAYAPPVSPIEPARRAETVASGDLRPGGSCRAVLDRLAWRRAWRAASASAAEDIEDDETRALGVPTFRRAIAVGLLRPRGLAATEEVVLATQGTTAALSEIVGAIHARVGRRVVIGIEEPGYPRAVGAARAAGAAIVSVPVDDTGILPDRIPPGLDAVYVTPAHQYPLGGALSEDRRTALVARARDVGMLVIEDEYDGELRYDMAPLPALAALGPDVVAHLGTTSKILSPGLGVGWMVAPEPLRSDVIERRHTSAITPARAGQRVVAELSADGAFARHIHRLRRELRSRRSEVTDVLGAAGYDVVGDRTGSHVLVPLPDRLAESETLKHAHRMGVRLRSLAEHFVGKPTQFGVLVGYAGSDRAEELFMTLQVAFPYRRAPAR